MQRNHETASHVWGIARNRKSVFTDVGTHVHGTVRGEGFATELQYSQKRELIVETIQISYKDRGKDRCW